MNTFTLFPTLTDTLQNLIGFSATKASFSYASNNLVNPVEIKDYEQRGQNTTGYLSDPKAEWSSDNYELYFEQHFEIDNVTPLFGVGGIAPANAKIGLGILWTDAKSQHRGYIKVISFSAADLRASGIAQHTFQRGELKGSITLNTILYIENPGVIQPSEKFLASDSGIIIGSLNTSEFYIDGKGSLFPIVINDAPGELLWKVRYDAGLDPLNDAFEEEHVCIYLNKAHPQYANISNDAAVKDNQLLIEILTSSLYIICDMAKHDIGEDWEGVISGSIAFETGSIAQAMSYFYNKLGWDFTDQIKLSESIRQYFEKHLKGDININEVATSE